MQIKVKRLALIAALKEEREKQLKAYRVAKNEFPGKFEKYRAKVAERLKEAAERAERARTLADLSPLTDYRNSLPRFPETPQEPKAPKLCMIEEQLRMLELATDAELSVGTESQLLRSLATVCAR